MAEPSGPDAESTTDPVEQADPPVETEPATEAISVGEAPEEGPEDDSAEPTEVMKTPQPPPEEPPAQPPTQRRFTAPSGFDAGATEKIDTPPDPATEVLNLPASPSARTEPVIQPPVVVPKTATPQSIPPRADLPRLRRHRSWGWVLALLLMIAALAAVAILGTVWLTRNSAPKVSQEDLVKQTIQNFDVAVQKGDLAALRGMTCGTTRDNYVNYDDHAWNDAHARIAAAKQYPVVASIDQVVVNGAHAEANVTTFMAFDPATRSTRSFDLQYRDDQWKVCQTTNN
jgi:hypothetical protein